MIQRLPGLVAIAGLLLSAVSTPAGEIAGYNTGTQASHETYDRFLGPFPGNPTMNTTSNFLLNGFTTDPGVGRNLTGIGWATNNPGAAITLVSPQHVIGAYHVFNDGAAFGLNSSISFVNRAGQVKSYQLSGAAPFRPTTTFTNQFGQPQTLPSDVYVGTLAAPINPADLVDYFPIVNAPTNAFTNRQIYAYGQNQAYVNPQTGTASTHVGTNNIDAVGILSFDGSTPVNEATAAYIFDWNPSVANEIHLIVGDSGGPSLLNINGQLAFVGGHYGLDPQSLTSADSFLPFYINQINASMLSNTPFSLTVTGIPEPSTLLMAGPVAGMWLIRRRKSRLGDTVGTPAE